MKIRANDIKAILLVAALFAAGMTIAHYVFGVPVDFKVETAVVISLLLAWTVTDLVFPRRGGRASVELVVNGKSYGRRSLLDGGTLDVNIGASELKG